MAPVSISLVGVSTTIKHKRILYNWLESVIVSEKKTPGIVSIILCSDAFLLDMNKQFLKHNYYTDIITFDYTEANVVSGELYISVDRVAENATTFNKTFLNELYRVMAHGVLHLCGYKDKTATEQTLMRKKEDQKLKLLTL